MSASKLLKGTVDEFGKISVTDDYTTNEREQIKSWIRKAVEQSAEDSFIKSGVPKNRLCMDPFAMQKPSEN